MKKTKLSRNPGDGRTLAPTEFLILALISYGHATTLYALQKETLLSAGALFPALAKLRGKGLLEADASGPRKRRAFRLAVGAVKNIEEKWKTSAPDHIADCDAVLKLCKAAEIFDLPGAVEYAHSAAELRAKELRKYTSRTGQVEAPQLDPFSYRSYRDVARFFQLQAEEQTLKQLEAALRSDL